MKHVDEYRRAEDARRLVDAIHALVTVPWTMMEICGGQTHTIMRTGIDRMPPEEITLERFSARLGPSDLSGAFRLDLRGKPDLKGEFTSNVIDVASLLPAPREEQGTAADTAQDEKETSAGQSKRDEKPRLLISDEPLAFETLNDANVELHWTIDDLHTTE